MASGIESADFLNGPLADFGQTVSYYEVTKTTSNITGDRTLTYAAAVNKTVVVLRRSTIERYDPEGELQNADAYCMVQISEGFKKDDKLSWGGNTYRIAVTVDRNPDGSTPMFTMCGLHQLE
jgi:hypothetical protein